MNKLFSKIAALSVGLAMAIGVGVAVGSKSGDVKPAEAANTTIAYSGSSTTNMTGNNDAATLGLNASSWSVVGAKGANNNFPGLNKNGYIAIYYAASGSNTITVTNLDGDTITSISVTYTASNYSNAVVKVGGQAVTGSSGTYDINSTSFVITNGNTSNVQVRVSSIDITYTSGGGGGTTTYSVTYNANGGTGSLSDPNSPYEENSSVTVLANTFTYSGYTFSKWNTAANGSGTDYNAGDKFTISGNTVLYAQWELGSKYTDDTTAQTITWDLSVSSYSSASADQVSWESPRVNMVADKAGASTAANNYLPPDQSSSRFYKNSTLTFAPQGDNGILSIEATATTEGYASALANSSWTNASAAVSGEDSKVVIITVTDGYEDAVATIGATTGLNKCVVHYGTPTPVTKYAVIDRVDDGSLNVTEVAEGTTLNATITPDDGYALPESVSVLMAGSPVEFTYANGVVTVQNVTGNVSIEGSCVKVNQILALYSKSSSASVDVYGYYVGFLDGTGPVIMDGEYGIVVYKKTADVSSYTERETILHVTGSISIYNGLYEIGGTVAIDEATSVPEGKVPATPVVYAAKGGETQEYASRLTTVTGVPAVTKGDITKDPGTEKNDITMTFNLGGDKSVQVFFKVAAQAAATDAYTALQEAVANESEITVRGFTGWYNGFQVQMNGYIPPAVGYTAEDFAQDLLNQTDAVCSGWEEGDNNHDAIEAIWSNLASNDKYPSLPSDQKTILAEAARDESGTVVERAMARYDFLTGKYDLSNFINGRTPVVTSNSALMFDDLANNNTAIIVIVIAAASALAFTTLLVFKKKKQK